MDFEELKKIVKAFMDGVAKVIALLKDLFNKSSKEEETTTAASQD